MAAGIFKKAQQIVEWAQSSQDDQGWTARGLNQFNRYWLAENPNNSNLRDFQNVMYKYHRLGLDQMAENLPKARRAILNVAGICSASTVPSPVVYHPRIPRHQTRRAYQYL
ncbi:MAG: DUF4835 family protein [Bacteroidia bacterium]